MIQRIKQGTDLLILLDLDSDVITGVSIDYYTDSTNKITKTLTNGISKIDGVLYAVLTSDDTKSFSGLLHSELTLHIANVSFPDSEQTVIEKLDLEAYFYE